MIEVSTVFRKPIELINEWLKAWGEEPKTRVEDLPSLGYEATHEGQEVAFMFLRKVEGNILMVDSMVTDPSAKPEIRHAALDALFEVALAREEKLIGTTIHKSMIWRAERHGFKKSNQTLMVLERNPII